MLGYSVDEMLGTTPAEYTASGQQPNIEESERQAHAAHRIRIGTRLVGEIENGALQFGAHIINVLHHLLSGHARAHGMGIDTDGAIYVSGASRMTVTKVTKR